MPRARELGFVLPGLPCGPRNAITDVAGVAVGHVTLHDAAHRPPVHTGVTVIIPHPGDLFNHKPVAAVHTINGFGKAAGFEQVRELGVLETPIALTNTLCVGRVWDGLVTWMLARHPEIGTSGPSVNPLVGECNDARLNDLRGRHVTAEHVLAALAAAAARGEPAAQSEPAAQREPGAQSGLVKGGPPMEGSVGAGTGMVCYGYKGGVGTASRLVEGWTLGALLVANFGRREQLTIHGVPVGRILADDQKSPVVRQSPGVERPTREEPPVSAPGSVMIVLATDAPLSDRQLGRVARRAGLGLARTGSAVSGGSGDFVIAFSTAQPVPSHPAEGLVAAAHLPEAALDGFFQAAVEAVEEAVLNALCQAEAVEEMVAALPVERVRALL